jgi:uncharacterized protein YjeT (DUF2065 family)
VGEDQAQPSGNLRLVGTAGLLAGFVVAQLRLPGVH